jgi:hypothetical protein
MIAYKSKMNTFILLIFSILFLGKGYDHYPIYLTSIFECKKIHLCNGTTKAIVINNYTNKQWFSYRIMK